MTSSFAFRGASSSTLSTHQWTHDVFLSFRGADTRKNFIAFLYDALDRRGIKTYIDDEEQLGRENEISLSLFKAIEESRILIVVFSQNYASSTWCLDELLKIVECKETKGQIILPLFYKVNPRDVRLQTGSFGDAFAKHDKRFKGDQRKVEKWRTALTLAANISGVCFDNNRNEAQVIDELVRRIALHTDFQVAKHPDGIKSLVEEHYLYGSPLGDWNDAQFSDTRNPDEIVSLVEEPYWNIEAQILDKVIKILQKVNQFIKRFKHQGGIESPVQVPHLSGSPNPIEIVPPVQLPQSSSPSTDDIESPVQVPNLSSSPSGNGEQGNNPSVSSEQQSNSSILSHGVILFLIASVIGLLQLDNLFKTHPANMWISEAALVMFSLSCAAMTKINGTHWAKYSQIIDRFRILSGTLVLASLSSIHLPHQLWWLFFAIWALLAFIVVAYTWVYQQAKGRAVETRISRAPV